MPDSSKLEPVLGCIEDEKQKEITVNIKVLLNMLNKIYIRDVCLMNRRITRFDFRI